ncbi:MAG: cobalamin biosynthesis protein [Methanosarcinales archaeon]|nr:cobalamin biosynthesis protein [ANME-2 cluster archaeon]MDF1532372.1 cobalamin biosynthesis protein [ANME-2 cluster archaeon]MDW7775945.1 cobalamin biosynthesis protein [Methanosarcinales archaeon]
MISLFSPGLEVLFLAFILDISFGEPPGIVHPVVWMGRFITVLQDLPLKDRRVLGILIVVVITGTSLLVGMLVVLIASSIHETAALLVMAYFLKSTFSIRMLLNTSRHIMNLLRSGNKDEAREALKALVSRDTANLDEHQMASAVVESISENFVDGVLSPVLFYLILGLPGALAYKAVNTLDSMIGYRNKEFIEMGRPSARLDDVLNWIPARLSLVLISASALVTGSFRGAVKICLRDNSRTSSPNSGWPMAAAAGALGVRLEKPGHYILGEELRSPEAVDIEQAARLVGAAVILLFAWSMGVLYLLHVNNVT